MARDISRLVEHFFRHEYGRLVAVLTKTLGVRELELVEDVVQQALTKGLQTWARSGVPDDPAGWLFRTARNMAIDAFRRRNIEHRVLSLIAETSHMFETSQVSSTPCESEPNEETLRFLFLCCHPSLAPASRVALALKLVGGFNVDEIANALLLTRSNAEKRVTRAKDCLRDQGLEISELTAVSVRDRLEPVLATIYLMFTEGYAATVGETAIRSDLCDEAIRLARMANQSEWCRSPATAALLALLLLQSSRMDARVDADGCIVLLADQDRTTWNTGRIREAMHWMTIAAQDTDLSRYHVEAAIAWEHARAETVDAVNWQRISELYRMLEAVNPGPMVRLNGAIARSRAAGAESGLRELEAFSDEDRKRLRPWWDCAVADAFHRLNRPAEAFAHLTDALALASNTAQRRLIELKRSRLQKQ